METEALLADDPQALQRAVDVIQRGGLVAFPTDTVYGLGAGAFEAGGIERLYVAKERSPSKAIPVLLAHQSDLALVALEVPAAAARLAEVFWPGALTLIVKRHPKLPDAIGPGDTVGVRVPDHAFARALLASAGPLATTSANLSGEGSLTTAADVLRHLEGRVELVLDGGPTPGTVPSTVVDCTSLELKVLRLGPIDESALIAALRNG